MLGGKELQVLIRNFSAHLEEGGGESRGREPPSLSCSLLSPCFLPVLQAQSPTLAPPPPSPHSSFPEQSAAPAGLGLLTLIQTFHSFAQPLGRENLEPMFASLSPFSAHTLTLTHSHAHTFAYLLSLGHEKGRRRLLLPWVAAAGGEQADTGCLHLSAHG